MCVVCLFVFLQWTKNRGSIWSPSDDDCTLVFCGIGDGWVGDRIWSTGRIGAGRRRRRRVSSGTTRGWGWRVGARGRIGARGRRIGARGWIDRRGSVVGGFGGWRVGGCRWGWIGPRRRRVGSGWGRCFGSAVVGGVRVVLDKRCFIVGHYFGLVRRRWWSIEKIKEKKLKTKGNEVYKRREEKKRKE